MANLKERYGEEIVPAMMERFSYKSVMQVPRLEKVVVNVGLGEALQDPKALDAAVGDLTAITGQKPVITRARKSIAAFKLRAGNPIGAKVTLRGERMYSFLDRLVNIALPRRRDFTGVPRDAFDGRGFVQTTRTTPRRRMILHLSHILFTEARTFTINLRTLLDR
jgi:large subunit ribosomal protein L5